MKVCLTDKRMAQKLCGLWCVNTFRYTTPFLGPCFRDTPKVTADTLSKQADQNHSVET